MSRPNVSRPNVSRPNVLIVYPDQLRADALGCAGNPVLRTPHIDRLAAEGVYFPNAYTAFPLCCPFRASLFTGRYPHTHGLCANHYPIPLGQPFLAELLRHAGYRTGYVGKWHLDGGPKHAYVPPGEGRLGFERFVGFSRGHHYLQPIFYRDPPAGLDRPGAAPPEPRTAARYEPDLQTDHLLEMLAAWRAEGTEPFLAMVSYGPAPSTPLGAGGGARALCARGGAAAGQRPGGAGRFGAGASLHRRLLRLGEQHRRLPGAHPALPR